LFPVKILSFTKHHPIELLQFCAVDSFFNFFFVGKNFENFEIIILLFPVKILSFTKHHPIELLQFCAVDGFFKCLY